jgi:16S rRNA (cytidine1402-2'-O)-methyltransferase
VLPGPSAVETALVASGLLAERYQFLGYLPRSAKGREDLWQELSHWPYPAVGFESPKRLGATLASLARYEPECELAVCRELTKRFEEVARGTALELAQRFESEPKGEITLVIAPMLVDTAAIEEPAVAAVAELVAAGLPRRRAVELVASLAGASRNRLYKRSL